MHPAGVCIGNQTNCHVPARLPYEFALRHGFDAFEWFSDKGRAGWCEDDTPPRPSAPNLRLETASKTLSTLFRHCAGLPLTG